MSESDPEIPKDADETTGLPTTEDRLFSDPSAVRDTWASDWERQHDWYHHVTGYKDAADVLFAHLGEPGRGAQKLGPPIVFLYRHHLELALKQLVQKCLNLLGRDDMVPRTHRLDQLWRLCLSLLWEIEAGNTAAEEVKQTTRLIDQFCRADPRSEAFRYPEDREGNPSLSGVGEVDLERVSEVVGKISLLLDCISTDLHARWLGAF